MNEFPPHGSTGSGPAHPAPEPAPTPVPTLASLLTARAARQPDRVAILLDGTTPLTFGEWERKSNAAAHGLLARGLRRGDPVGLHFGGSGWLDYAVAYVAVHRAGGVAVPLSDRLAASQVRERLDHCSAAGCLHTPGLTVPDGSRWTATLDELDTGDPTPPAVELRAEDLADILYTSGTTGNPKGVAVTHANLAFGMDIGDTLLSIEDGSEYFLAAFPIGTAAGQAMLVFAVTGQATMVLASRYETEEFARIIASVGVGSVMLVPAMAIDMVGSRVWERHDLSCVTAVGSGSAPLPPATAVALSEAFPNAVVSNYYGSTESAPAATSMRFDPARPTSVGRPPEGVELRVVDADGRELPVGEVGEVCLRSPAPPRSYLHDPERTARTFGDGWTHMGDFGHLDSDGYLYLVDRDSDVVKVGGLKVSTLQVEAVLYEHPAVAQAAVVGVPHPVMGKTVAAAVVLRAPLAMADLRTYLRGRLADYELPTRVLVVDEIPRSTMGKPLKREVRALFEGTAPGSASGIPPTSQAEVALALLWREILDVPDVFVDDDFFALGGDSLAAAKLASRAAGVFGVEVPATVVFDVPVLAHQAAWILARREEAPATEDGAAATVAPHHARPVTGPVRVPLGPFQERSLMWVFDGRPQHTLPVCTAIRVREPVEPGAVRRAVEEIARRHEGLRTVFVPDGAAYEAVVEPDLLPDFESVTVDGASVAEREGRARELARAFVEQPFDVTGGPLFRASVLTLGPRDHVVLVGADHLVSDGLSIGVLLRELGLLYSAFAAGQSSPLPPLAVQCADYFAWARAQFPRTREYWERELDGAPEAVGTLPGQRTAPRGLALRTVHFPVPDRIAARLRGAYRDHGVTVFMAGLSAWSAVLANLTGAPEVVSFSPMSGRTRPEFEPLIGSILQNTYFRLRTGDDPTFRELFARARAAVVGATENQFFPHYEFMKKVPFPARFSVDDWFVPPRLPGLASEPFAFPADLVPDRDLDRGERDLHVPRLRLMSGDGGSLTGSLSYNMHALDRPAVERLAGAFLRHAETALDDPDRHIGDVPAEPAS